MAVGGRYHGAGALPGAALLVRIFVIADVDLVRFWIVMAAAGVLPPNPVGTIRPVFTLPDRNVVLDAIDEESTSAEGLGAVRSGGHADDGSLAHLERAETMGGGDAHAGKLLLDSLPNARELLLRHRGVGVVFEQGYGAAGFMIADDTEENVDPAALRGRSQGDHGGEVERLALHNETTHELLSLTNRPLCPPDFSRRRVGPMLIERSIPFSMS